VSDELIGFAYDINQQDIAGGCDWGSQLKEKMLIAAGGICGANLRRHGIAAHYEREADLNAGSGAVIKFDDISDYMKRIDYGADGCVNNLLHPSCLEICHVKGVGFTSDRFTRLVLHLNGEFIARFCDSGTS
jgi:hypothetical protein